MIIALIFITEDNLRYRIIAVTAPRVAAEDAADGEVETFEGAVLAECLESIL